MAEEVKDAKAATKSSLKSFLSGGFGGSMAVLVGHPFDLTKVRLQTAETGVYNGAIDVVKQSIAKDGARGLYKGVLPPLVGVTPIFALSFWSYDLGKKIVFGCRSEQANREKGTSLSTSELAFAGFFSAVPTTLITSPVERVKVLQQTESKKAGMGSVISRMYKEGGLKSVYRGTGATLARDGPGSIAYFVSYEQIKKMLTPADSTGELNLGAVLTAGGLAGVTMWSFAIPPDVIKSRIQSAPEGVYKGFVDCAVKTVKADGMGALFKGFGPAMARAFPANAATFLGVEISAKALEKVL
ncbi:hypothetical protein E3P92_01563 [Wallemia ichthyophaga]|uniref:Mitochondrial carnitine carrier n=2 Tax=Wallemia ichthyophaga TaxID=245174 RepID=A0A4T0F752_WALIC|nr:uncharacterized protein J056_004186 [Wallemia ichthyophaga EXF-994]TIA73601.1 hypothetical protein E3P91_01400 [Wallemia ichthyophaga]EOR01400.1 hypothetical protein J056_004186 [Wallemia ichthyophaga EXF-994]TIA82436.1 hypothetical protein E3P98_01421 [Wallemia ichthyophaga]TIB00927.1 hypothetical protein E3P95_01516 [Wallemia ichthyophaga]TIB01903.1 hypothetical protein E3P94_01648 [Wallemia ichthyophaga]